MNFSKSKVLLKKINAIHDSGASFDNQLSSLEKDLLLQYLRDLYECVKEDQVTNEKVAEQIIKVPRKQVTEVKKVVEEPISPQAVIDENISITTENHQPGANGHVHEVVKADPELEALFDHSELTDLSQRFANSPIKDVSKAMGINEKILTMNDLFKGNQQVFDEVVNRLNTFSSFEDAKDYLIQGVASTNGWANKKHKNKAEVFIKLVRRRYL